MNLFDCAGLSLPAVASASVVTTALLTNSSFVTPVLMIGLSSWSIILCPLPLVAWLQDAVPEGLLHRRGAALASALGVAGGARLLDVGHLAFDLGEARLQPLGDRRGDVLDGEALGHLHAARSRLDLAGGRHRGGIGQVLARTARDGVVAVRGDVAHQLVQEPLERLELA